MSPAALAASQDIAGKVTDALGGPDNKGWGVFGVELFIKGDQVWFSEVSPRPHDTGLVTLATQRLSEFELHARAILGLPVDTSLRRPGASAVIYGGLEEKGIAFEGVAAALQVLAVVKKLDQPVSKVCHRFDPLPQILKNVRYSSGRPLEDTRVVKAIDAGKAKLGEGGRLVIRPSGTEPVIRVMAEGDDAAQVEAVVDRICAVIAEVAA